MKICYSIIIVVFIMLLLLSLKKKYVKRDTFTYSAEPVDDSDESSSVKPNPDLFLQKARISNNEVVVCKTINGQYQCKIKREPCTS